MDALALKRHALARLTGPRWGHPETLRPQRPKPPLSRPREVPDEAHHEDHGVQCGEVHGETHRQNTQGRDPRPGLFMDEAAARFTLMHLWPMALNTMPSGLRSRSLVCDSADCITHKICSGTISTL